MLASEYSGQIFERCFGMVVWRDRYHRYYKLDGSVMIIWWLSHCILVQLCRVGTMAIISPLLLRMPYYLLRSVSAVPSDVNTKNLIDHTLYWSVSLYPPLTASVLRVRTLDNE